MSTFAESFSRLTDLFRHQPSDDRYTAYSVPNKVTGANSDSEIAAPYGGGRGGFGKPCRLIQPQTGPRPNQEDLSKSLPQPLRAATVNSRRSTPAFADPEGDATKGGFAKEKSSSQHGTWKSAGLWRLVRDELRKAGFRQRAAITRQSPVAAFSHHLPAAPCGSRNEAYSHRVTHRQSSSQYRV